MHNNTKIMKFGGAAIKQKQSLCNLLKVIDLNQNNRIICVVSAFGKTTGILKSATHKSLIGNYNDAMNDIHELNQFHNQFTERETKIRLTLEILFSEITGLLKGISITKELTPATLDKVISYGEIIAGKIIENQMINHQIKAKYIDSSHLIITDDNFGNANPVMDITAQNINNKIKKYTNENYVVVVPGFTASTQQGQRTTMGMESSNLTALLLADVLKIKEITIWTDVEGIRSADPILFDKTIPVSNMSYEQAEIAAYFGLKLIYRNMINIARINKIKIIYKSLINPDSSKTEISDKAGNISQLIINDSYDKLPKNDNFKFKTNPVFSDMDYIYINSNMPNSKYALITIINDESNIFMKIISQFKNKYEFELIEFNSKSISIIVKKENLKKAGNFINELINFSYERDLVD